MGRLIIDGVEDSEDYYAGSSLFRYSDVIVNAIGS